MTAPKIEVGARVRRVATGETGTVLAIDPTDGSVEVAWDKPSIAEVHSGWRYAYMDGRIVGAYCACGTRLDWKPEDEHPPVPLDYQQPVPARRYAYEAFDAHVEEVSL